MAVALQFDNAPSSQMPPSAASRALIEWFAILPRAQVPTDADAYRGVAPLGDEEKAAIRGALPDLMLRAPHLVRAGRVAVARGDFMMCHIVVASTAPLGLWHSKQLQFLIGSRASNVPQRFACQRALKPL